MNRKKFFIAAMTFLIYAMPTVTICDHMHTHIARNQDQVWGTADDGKLWLFSDVDLDEFPNWPRLELIPKGVFHPVTGKQDYVCAALNCWHSAHPPHGNWQLGGDDHACEPLWDIRLRRVGFDDDFFMLDGRLPVLTSDGSELKLGHEWLDEAYNENGGSGAYGVHAHLYFHAWAQGPGEIFNAAFQVVDCGVSGYSASEVYTISFVTVPEPSSALIIIAGLISAKRWRKAVRTKRDMSRV